MRKVKLILLATDKFHKEHFKEIDKSPLYEKKSRRSMIKIKKREISTNIPKFLKFEHQKTINQNKK